MKLTLLGFVAANFIVGSYARGCRVDYYYCGHTLESGKGYDKSELLAAINKDPYPNPNAQANVGDALFQCYSGDRIFFVGYCNEECEDRGRDHDDMCTAPR